MIFIEFLERYKCFSCFRYIVNFIDISLFWEIFNVVKYGNFCIFLGRYFILLLEMLKYVNFWRFFILLGNIGILL